MTYSIESVTEVTDRPALNELLLEFYAVMLRKFAAAGGPPNYTPNDLIASFWPNLQKVLPLTGRLILAYKDERHLVGCGTLHQARPNAGELKRLYARWQAAGHGLGRAIINARKDAAREMWWQSLLVDSPKGNREMLNIYENLGFRYIDRYQKFSDPIEVAEFFVKMQLDLYQSKSCSGHRKTGFEMQHHVARD